MRVTVDERAQRHLVVDVATRRVGRGSNTPAAVEPRPNGGGGRLVRTLPRRNRIAQFVGHVRGNNPRPDATNTPSNTGPDPTGQSPLLESERSKRYRSTGDTLRVRHSTRFDGGGVRRDWSPAPQPSTASVLRPSSVSGPRPGGRRFAPGRRTHEQDGASTPSAALGAEVGEVSGEECDAADEKERADG